MEAHVEDGWSGVYDGVFIQADIVHRRPRPLPFYEKSGEEEVKLLDTLRGNFEEEVELDDVSCSHSQVVDFEVLVILYFPGVVVVRYLADFDMIVGLDLKTHHHFLLQGHLSLHGIPYIINQILPVTASRRVLAIVKRCTTWKRTSLVRFPYVDLMCMGLSLHLTSMYFSTTTLKISLRVFGPSLLHFTQQVLVWLVPIANYSDLLELVRSTLASLAMKNWVLPSSSSSTDSRPLTLQSSILSQQDIPVDANAEGKGFVEEVDLAEVLDVDRGLTDVRVEHRRVVLFYVLLIIPKTNWLRYNSQTSLFSITKCTSSMWNTESLCT